MIDRGQRDPRTFGLTSHVEVAILVGFLVVLAFSGYQLIGAASALVASRSEALKVGTLRAGDVFPEIRGVAFNSGKPTVIAVLARDCIYCTQSLPFYRRLLSDKGNRGFVFLALCRDAEDICHEYLANAGVVPDEIASTSDIADRLRIRGTPTLLLVEPNRRIVDVWTGLQNTEEQKKISELLEPWL